MGVHDERLTTATNRERLDSFRRLEPGWAGDGVPPIDPAIIDAAAWLLDRLPAGHERAAYAYPTPGGGVQLEWRSPDGTRELDLEFRSPHAVEAYLWRYPDIERLADRTFNPAMDLAEITDLIRSVLET